MKSSTKLMWYSSLLKTFHCLKVVKISRTPQAPESLPVVGSYVLHLLQIASVYGGNQTCQHHILWMRTSRKQGRHSLPWAVKALSKEIWIHYLQVGSSKFMCSPCPTLWLWNHLFESWLFLFGSVWIFLIGLHHLILQWPLAHVKR